jgi:ribosome-associated toxin RatA of RatAB toxin-antitoxin module
MKTVDHTRIHAPLSQVFAAATEVERWPQLLSHYRWVRMLDRRKDGGLVEMAAWRPFGLVSYPTWWVSEMTVDWDTPAVHYKHVRGITTGMDVQWRFVRMESSIKVTITHDWDGPAWPVIGAAAAEVIIGPVFISGIASRTLAGIKRYVESHK